MSDGKVPEVPFRLTAAQARTYALIGVIASSTWCLKFVDQQRKKLQDGTYREGKMINVIPLRLSRNPEFESLSKNDIGKMRRMRSLLAHGDARVYVGESGVVEVESRESGIHKIRRFSVEEIEACAMRFASLRNLYNQVQRCMHSEIERDLQEFAENSTNIVFSIVEERVCGTPTNGQRHGSKCREDGVYQCEECVKYRCEKHVEECRKKEHQVERSDHGQAKVSASVEGLRVGRGNPYE